MLFLPFQQFIVPLLLLGDGTLEESYFMLVAHVEVVNGQTEVVLVVLELLDACFVLIGVRIGVVACAHLNIDS